MLRISKLRNLCFNKKMEFCACYSLSSYSPTSSLSFCDAVIKVKEYTSYAASVILGNVFSFIFSFVFASGLSFVICQTEI